MYETPVWMVERLRRSGVRSIDPVVDVTNYVMIELGQPMHGFDLEQLNGKIIVRKAKADEKITLLDGQEIKLDPSILVIADNSGPLAMAGIMGGENSGVSDKTTRVFLESAFFEPIEIAGKARSHGLHTDSSHRFERGVDSSLQELAIERATALLIDICGANPGPVIVKENKETTPKAAEIELYASTVSSSLGMTIENPKIKQILIGLGFSIIDERDGYWKVKAPTWRFDMAIQADLIEELARIYGYNNLPVTAPMAAMKPQGQAEQGTPINSVVDRMVS